MFSYNVLQNVLQLEHLILKIGHISLTIQDMEVILTACPQLKGLEINLNHYNEIFSLLAAKDGDPTTTKTTITPAACFKKLVLQPDTCGDDEHFYKNAWFKYIQCKYPGLKYLNMNKVEQTHALSEVYICLRIHLILNNQCFLLI